MKKLLLGLLIGLGLTGSVAYAQTVPLTSNFFKQIGTTISLIQSNWNLQVPSLSNAPCVGTNSAGTFISESCSGSSTSISINGLTTSAYTLAPGSNITIATSAPGTITISSSGSTGSGTISTSTNAIIGHEADWTGAATLGNGAILDNGTVAGVGATSSTVSFNIQGTGTLNPFNVSSSSGTSLLQVNANGNVGIGSSTPTAALTVNSTTTNLIGAYNNNSPELILNNAGSLTTYGPLQVYVNGIGNQYFFAQNDSAGGVNFGAYNSSFVPFKIDGSPLVLNSRANNNVGINTTTPNAQLEVSGYGTTNPLNITSSTGASELVVASNGSTTLSSLTAGNVVSTASGALYVIGQTGTGLNVLQTSPTLVTPILGVASGTALSLSDAEWITGQSNLTTASATALSVSGNSTLATTSITSLKLGDGITNTFLAADPNGKIIATTTPAGTGGITGTGTSTQIAVFTGATTQTSYPDLTWNEPGTVLAFGSGVATGGLTYGSNYIVGNGPHDIALLSGEGNINLIPNEENLSKGYVQVINDNTPNYAWQIGTDNLSANRLIQVPDEAGTFALATSGSTGKCAQWTDNNTIGSTSSACGSGGGSPGGTGGEVQYNSNSAFAGSGDLFDTGTVSGVNATSSTINFDIQGTGALNNAFNVASSSGNSILKVLPSNGILLSMNASSTNSSSTDPTSAPTLQLGNTTLATLSNNGTVIGSNQVSNFAGNLIEIEKGGTSEFTLNSTGQGTFDTFQIGQGGNSIGPNGTGQIRVRGGLGGAGGSAVQVDNDGDSISTTGNVVQRLFLTQEVSGFAPTSGSAITIGAELDGWTINQTGTATGTTYNVWLNTPVTSAYNFINFANATTTVTLSNQVPVKKLYNYQFNPFSYATASTSVYTIATSSTQDITGEPIPTATGKVILTNSNSLLIDPGIVNASTTNAYGANIFAPSGAGTLNAALQTTGQVYNQNLTTASGSSEAGYACYDSNGQLINDSLLCVSVSAERFKNDIKPLTPGLAEVMQLQAKSFYFKPGVGDSGASLQYGLIADEVEKIDSHLVVFTDASSTFDGITYPPHTVQGLAPDAAWDGLFVNAIQQQQKEIENITVGKVKDVQDNWQWIAIALLTLGFSYQQIQINRLKKK